MFPTSQVLVEWNLQADSNTIIFLQQINQQQIFSKNNKYIELNNRQDPKITTSVVKYKIQLRSYF